MRGGWRSSQNGRHENANERQADFVQRWNGPTQAKTGLEWATRLRHQIWIGDAAQIRASYVRQQKTDKRDAAHILKLVVEGRFPRLWTPDREQRDLRQLVLHRHQLVEIRSRVKNELQHFCLNKGHAEEAHAVEASRPFH